MPYALNRSSTKVCSAARYLVFKKKYQHALINIFLDHEAECWKLSKQLKICFPSLSLVTMMTFLGQVNLLSLEVALDFGADF